ncbi:MAG: ADP-ribosylglycohydrolase family protein [Saprospiraceae bacterium]|nr:ADP-ribosylglycohydrolase family protein [Saprospiraceae bacterium]
MINERLEQVRHFLLGTAIGDAFGAGVEFQDRNWIREHVDFTALVHVRDRIQVPADQLKLFTENYTPWDYTDDTEMTIGLMKALSDSVPFSEDLLVHHWKTEYEQGIRQKGYGRNGHGSMGWYFRGEQDLETIRNFQRDRANPGNAPVMRAAPLAWVKETEINTYAAINATATHPNAVAIQASQCIARAAHYMMVLKGEAKEVLAYCRQTVQLDEAFVHYFEAVDKLPAYDDLAESDFAVLCGPQPIEEPYFLPGIFGVPSDAFYTTGCVLYLLKHSVDALDALRKSVLLGGDVDSVASLTTGILAARTGIGSLPTYMLEQVEGGEYLSIVASNFAQWLSR